jgi:type IV secretory pathway TrbL component
MLTDDMTRLCDEIVAMRKMRGSMMTELQHGAKGRKHSVTKLCAHFGRVRATMAKRTKNERVAFLNNLKRTVGAQRRDLINDLAGARRAWAGKSS